MKNNLENNEQLLFIFKKSMEISKFNLYNQNNKKELNSLVEIVALNILINFATSAFIGLITKKSMSILEKRVKNKQFCDYLDNKMIEILKEHPDYIPCNNYEFKQTMKYEQYISRFKDKNFKENIKQSGKVLINILFDKKFGPQFIKFLLTLGILPIPEIVLKTSSNAIIKFLTPLLKSSLNIFGISINSGTLGNKLFVYNNYVYEAGVEFSPVGLRVVNIRAYFFKGENKSLVSVQIPNPPDSIFIRPKKEIKKNISKYFLMDSKERFKEARNIIAEG